MSAVIKMQVRIEDESAMHSTTAACVTAHTPLPIPMQHQVGDDDNGAMHLIIATTNVNTLCPGEKEKPYVKVDGVMLMSKVTVLDDMFENVGMDVIVYKKGARALTENVEVSISTCS